MTGVVRIGEEKISREKGLGGGCRGAEKGGRGKGRSEEAGGGGEEGHRNKSAGYKAQVTKKGEFNFLSVCSIYSFVFIV